MFSYFTNHSQNIPAGVITLPELHRQLIAPDREPFLRAANLVKHLRAATDEAEAKAIKSQLPAICPGATLDTRATGATPEQQNISYSGFAQIDIDLHDNPNMTDAAEVRDKLAQIPYIALTAISARGRGVWALIALKEPGKFTEYAEPITEFFKRARVTIDKSKSKRPTELRYFAPDPGAILKNEYQLFPLIRPQSKPKPAAGNRQHTGATFEQVQRWVSETTGFNLVDGQKHYYLFWLAYGLRKNGMDPQSVYQLIYDNVLPESCVHSNCISGGIAYANTKGIYTPQTAKTAPQITHPRVTKTTPASTREPVTPRQTKLITNCIKTVTGDIYRPLPYGRYQRYTGDTPGEIIGFGDSLRLINSPSFDCLYTLKLN
ncbi:MAG TPA: BT4734/BF3469 family protein [Bacteroidales bacterium]|nr:BT4734/BF3469 family protein [Bacteroidales bacterium]